MHTVKRNFIITIIFASIIILCGIAMYAMGNIAWKELGEGIQQSSTPAEHIGDVEGYALLINTFQDITNGLSVFVSQLVATLMIVYGVFLIIMGIVAKAIFKNNKDRIIAYRIVTAINLAIMAIPLFALIQHSGLMIHVERAPIIEYALFCADLAACIVIARGTYSSDVNY